MKKNRAEQRLLALLTLLTDTGVRINEALTLTRPSVDFENLLLTVTGKGNKTRIIPFSIEARKTLFKHLRSHSHEVVFSNRQGGKLRYDNLRRDFRKLISKLGIQGVDGSFHAFRRYFVTYSIRKNVNPFLVQRMVGHSSLQMTSRYLQGAGNSRLISRSRISTSSGRRCAMKTSHYKYIRREFLNHEPNELAHTSYVMGFVENSHRGESLADAMVHIADCRRVVVLNFFLSRPEVRTQSLKKIDLLLEVLTQFKKALVREAKIIERAEQGGDDDADEE